MNTLFFKSAAVVLSLTILLTTFSACNKAPVVDETAKTTAMLTIEADGQKITIEDAAGKTVEQLLEQAEITLNDGDVLSISPEQILANDMTVRVLRKSTVTVTVAAEDPLKDTQYTIVMVGGTVAQAIAAAGIKLTDKHVVNHELGKALENEMDIIISVEKEPETEETKPTESESNDDSSSDSDSSYNSNYNSNSNSYTTRATAKPTTKATAKPTTKATAKPTTKATTPTTAAKTVVSVEIYEDCDGSGHGVKVITYSDGTQEEVPF